MIFIERVNVKISVKSFFIMENLVLTLHFLYNWRFLHDFSISRLLLPGTAVAQWSRCCATSRKIAGSIPDGVIEIFH